VKRLGILLAAVVVVAAGWSSWHSDRRRIDRRLERLERACEKQGPSSALSLLNRSRTLLDSFAPGFVVSAHPYAGTISDPRELVQAVEGYRGRAELVRIRDTDRSLRIGKQGTAEMSVVFVVQGRERGGGPGGARFRANLFWVKGDGGWKIRDLEIVQVLENRGLFP